MRNTVITIGTFDGVHLGHQEIINTVNRIGIAFDLDPLILVLNAPPKWNHRNGRFLITTDEEKLFLLKNLSAGKVEVLNFTDELQNLTASQFLNFLMEEYKLKHIVLGFNHAFGKDRSGDARFLVENLDKFGINVTVVPPVRVDSCIISSTLIRELLYDGKVKEVSRCLGRFYSVKGLVVKGMGVARELGFRTVNLEIPEKKIIPKKGVYAVIVEVLGRVLSGACYIGENKTLGLNKLSFEVHIIGIDEDLYGREVNVNFVEFLRDDMKFESVEALTEQIRKDIQKAKQLISQFL